MFRSVVAIIAGATLACLASCALTPEPAASEARSGNVYIGGYALIGLGINVVF